MQFGAKVPATHFQCFKLWSWTWVYTQASAERTDTAGGLKLVGLVRKSDRKIKWTGCQSVGKLLLLTKLERREERAHTEATPFLGRPYFSAYVRLRSKVGVRSPLKETNLHPLVTPYPESLKPRTTFLSKIVGDDCTAIILALPNQQLAKVHTGTTLARVRKALAL